MQGKGQTAIQKVTGTYWDADSPKMKNFALLFPWQYDKRIKNEEVS